MKGGMQGMMKQIQKMQAEMERVQNELGDKIVTEESGGGVVKATVNGKKELVSLQIDDEIIKGEEDKEMLEDLIVAAVNKALESAGKMAEEEMQGVTKGMIPPGMNIPGM
ncbi:MAG: YbaB/EbfC family nucleoid-associated protein [Melioribacteraceae bacterium]|nr:YbaB/EbfC family nucleoid-associated protein [Melioribacteraceae bacterium]